MGDIQEAVIDTTTETAKNFVSAYLGPKIKRIEKWANEKGSNSGAGNR